MSEILQSVSLLDDSGLANGCNSRLSGQNTSKSSRGAFNLKVESSRNGVLGQAGGVEAKHSFSPELSTFAAVLQESIQVCLMNIQGKIDKDEKIDYEE